MPDETQGTATPDAPQYVSMDDFRKFQSTKDSEISYMARQLQEERTLNDDLGSEVAALRQSVMQREARELESDDPRLADLTKQLRQKESELAQHQRFVRQITPQFKQILVENHGLRLSAREIDDQAFRMAAEYLSAARNPQEVKALADRLRESGVGRTPPPPTGGAGEVDTGRGAARGGNPPITRALLQERRGDLDWWRENKSRINDALTRGGGHLPER